MDCKQAEELLPVYALNALGPEEGSQLEAHLGACPWCPALLREHTQVAAALAQVAEPLEPSQGLKKRILRAAGKGREQERRKGWWPVTSGRLVPAAASLAIPLLVGITAIGVRMSLQIDNLQDENAELGAQVVLLTGEERKLGEMVQAQQTMLTAQEAQLTKDEEKLEEMFLEQRSLNYVTASPDKEVVSLRGGTQMPQAQGMLMITAQGRTAILMAKGLEPSSGDEAYHIALITENRRTILGRLTVDEMGWGVMTLWPDPPITSVQEVWVLKEPARGSPLLRGEPESR